MLTISLPRNQSISMTVKKQLLCMQYHVRSLHARHFDENVVFCFWNLNINFFLHKHRRKNVVLRDTYVLCSSVNKKKEVFSRENANRGDVLGRDYACILL
jgi:hypothetical protein